MIVAASTLHYCVAMTRAFCAFFGFEGCYIVELGEENELTANVSSCLLGFPKPLNTDSQVSVILLIQTCLVTSTLSHCIYSVREPVIVVPNYPSRVTNVDTERCVKKSYLLQVLFQGRLIKGENFKPITHIKGNLLGHIYYCYCVIQPAFHFEIYAIKICSERHGQRPNFSFLLLAFALFSRSGRVPRAAECDQGGQNRPSNAIHRLPFLWAFKEARPILGTGDSGLIGGLNEERDFLRVHGKTLLPTVPRVQGAVG